MRVQKITKHEEPRGWWTEFRYPLALTQKFTFDHNYADDVNAFIDGQLRPRMEWLIDQKIKCRVRYVIDSNGSLDVMESIILVIEFRKPNVSTMYKLRWG